MRFATPASEKALESLVSANGQTRAAVVLWGGGRIELLLQLLQEPDARGEEAFAGAGGNGLLFACQVGEVCGAEVTAYRLQVKDHVVRPFGVQRAQGVCAEGAAF